MIQKVDLAAVAKKLTEPYMLVDLAHVDDFAARLFLCHGGIAWHKHIDEDELFLVLEGEMALESEWGSHTLRAGEMAVVPKGVTHRSASTTGAVVFLFQRRLFSNRQNGRRRLFVLQGQGSLLKANVEKRAQTLSPFSTLDLAYVDDFVVQAAVCQGRSEWRTNPRTMLLLMQEGETQLETEVGQTLIKEGEMARIPRGTLHRLLAEGRGVSLLFARKPSGEMNESHSGR